MKRSSMEQRKDDGDHKETPKQWVEKNIAIGQEKFDSITGGKRHGLFRQFSAFNTVPKIGKKIDREKRPIEDSGKIARQGAQQAFTTQIQRADTASRNARSQSSHVSPKERRRDVVSLPSSTWDPSSGAWISGPDDTQMQTVHVQTGRGDRSPNPSISHADPYRHDKDLIHGVAKNTENSAPNVEPSELIEIAEILGRASLQYPELIGPEGQSARDAVIRIVQQYERVSSNQKGVLETEGKMQNELINAHDVMRDLRERATVSSRKLTEFEEQYNLHVHQLSDQIEKHKFERNQYAAMQNAKLQEQQRNHRREVAALSKTYEERLKRATDDASSHVKEIKDLRSQMVSLSNHFEAENRDLKVKSEKELSRQRGLMDSDKKSFEFHLQTEKRKQYNQMMEMQEKLTKQHQEECAKLKIIIEDLKLASSQTDAALEAKNADLMVRLRTETTEKDQYIAQCEARLRKEREEFSFSLRELQNQNERERQSQICEADERLKVEVEKHKTMIQESLRELQERNERERQKQIFEADKRLSEEVEKHKTMVQELEASHTAQCGRLKADAEMRIKTQQHKYESMVKEMKSTFLDIVELKKDVDQQIPDSQAILPSLKEKLGNQPGTDIQQLRSVAEGMKIALSKEQYKGLKDHHIVGRFRSIANEIIQLSRIEWDVAREARWPCSESTMFRLHPQNTRKLKQYIVQSSLWTFLYTRIFRSPFCIFGPEGAEMDSFWEDIYATSSSPRNWPEIPLDVEKKRCAYAKRCLTLMEPGTEARTDDEKLKASYEMLVVSIVETFSKLMEKVVCLDEPGRKKMLMTMSNIVRLCAKTWLECCSQNYRLMMRLGVTNGNILAMAPKPMTSLTLVRTPELKRFGSIKGANLNKEESLSGWQAALDTYP